MFSRQNDWLVFFFHYFRPRTRPLFPVNLRNLTSVWFGERLQGHMATLDQSELNSTKICLLLPWASVLGLWCIHQDFKSFKYMRFLKNYPSYYSFLLYRTVCHHIRYLKIMALLYSKCKAGLFELWKVILMLFDWLVTYTLVQSFSCRLGWYFGTLFDMKKIYIRFFFSWKSKPFFFSSQFDSQKRN